MRNNSGWFRQLGTKLMNGTRQFMSGRYGHDKLNVALLTVGLVICVIRMFAGDGLPALVLTLAAYALLLVALLRCFSRNTYKRYQENRRYMLLLDRIKDREHRYYSCPKCHQTVRVPRNKGKISITCPKCREKFIKKT